MPKSSLHICLLSEEYPPETGWGGIGTYTYNMAHALQRAGHDVQVIAGCLDQASTGTENGVTVHRIGFAPPRQGTWRAVYNLFRITCRTMPEFRRRLEFARAACGLVRRLHQQQPFDLIESAEYNANGFFVSRPDLPPLVVRFHTPLLTNHHLNHMPVSLEVRLSDLLEKRMSRKAVALSSPSVKMATLVRHWLKPRQPITVIPNPIDTCEFQPEGPPASDLDGDYFFYTGRLERRKGVHLLLAAFQQIHRQIPGVRLVLAGHDTPTFLLDGSHVPFLDYARATGLLDGIEDKVIFLGRIDRRRLPPFYRSSLACVFPSEEFENFPYSCLEALACGRAAIVTDSGGMSEMVVSGECGECVPAGEVPALAEALLRMGSDPARCRQMGLQARRRVMEEYGMDVVANRMLSFYREVLSR